MKIGVILTLLLAFVLGGCSKKDEADMAFAPSCTAAAAKAAAQNVLRPALAHIMNPATRSAGCSELDEILKDTSGTYAFERYRPKNGCEWDIGEANPSAAVKAILTPRSAELSTLCEWERKDAEHRFETRGEEILQKASPEDRQTLERAYNGM
jgi:hypothetical protein